MPRDLKYLLFRQVYQGVFVELPRTLLERFEEEISPPRVNTLIWSQMYTEWLIAYSKRHHTGHLRILGRSNETEWPQ